MDEIVREGETFAYSDKDIKRLLDDDVRILRYPELAQCTSLEDILQGSSCACILYMTKDNFGHWTALIKNPGGQPYSCEVFDPYGMVPDEELKYIDDDYRVKSNQVRKHLSHILAQDYERGNIKDIYYNRTQLQKEKNGINTCGRWCAIRCFLKTIPLEYFVKLFMNQTLPPDMLVTYMTIVNK